MVTQRLKITNGMSPHKGVFIKPLIDNLFMTLTVEISRDHLSLHGDYRL